MRELAATSKTYSWISAARVVIGVAMVAGFGAIAWTNVGDVGWVGEGIGFVAFVVLIMMHARVVERTDRLDAALAFYKRGLAREASDWAAACRWVDINAASREHPYAFDLDVVGERSLIAVLDESVTPWGRRELSRLLLGEALPTKQEIHARQIAVRDMAERAEFREGWFAEGRCLDMSEARIGAFVRWTAEDQLLVASGAVRLAAKLIPVLTISLFVAYQLGKLPWWSAAGSLGLGIFISVGHHRGLAPITSGAIALGACRSLLRRLESQTFTAPLLVELNAALSPGGKRASEHLDALARITGFLEASNHAVFRLFVAPVFLWDLNGAIALDRWRKQSSSTDRGATISAWPRVLGAIDALACLATFAYEHPDFVMPELADHAVFEAKGLGHPLLARGSRVTNDVSLAEAGRALLVTGSNMSGKSTLLRAVGINAVLAYAGAPVCAASMRIGSMQLGTSMRVQDSLTDGYSHFYAELRRLKQVTVLAAAGPLLFLLDEILHGTNARERIIGAKSVVRALLKRDAIGIVSTHDTQIGALEEESGGRVKNVHFIETVEGEQMRFDYTLREGVVQSGNALRLMKALGLEVSE